MAERSSRKQQELLQFIDDFIKQHSYGPSYREIMNGLGYKSVSTVAVHVNGLLTRGYIRKKDNSARSIEIVTMRHETADSTPSASGHIHWLEAEIEKRRGDEALSGETEVLIDAAIILGSQKAVALRAKKRLKNTESDIA